MDIDRYTVWVFVDKRTCIFNYCTKISPSTALLVQYLPIGPLLFVIVLRIWYLYYDLKYAEAIISHQWWQILSSADKDWFIENRNKYGKLSTTMHTIISSVILIYIIYIIICAYFTNVLLPEMFLGPFCVGLWITMATLFYKMPKHYDVFAIRKEINRWTIWYLITGTYFIINAAGLEAKYPFFVHIHAFVFMIETAGFAIFSTVYPYYQIKVIDKRSKINTPPILTNAASTSNSESNESSIDGNNMWYSWINACEDDTNFNAFMRQLIKEVFCTCFC